MTTIADLAKRQVRKQYIVYSRCLANQCPARESRTGLAVALWHGHCLISTLGGGQSSAQDGVHTEKAARVGRA